MKRLAAMLVCAAPCSAQLVVYDAGTAGNPAVAPDPVTQGWSTSGFAAAIPISPDGASGLNAWEINDPDQAGYRFYSYWPSFGWPQNAGDWAGGWELTVTMKVAAGGPNGAVFFELGDGPFLASTRWVVWFEVSGSDLVAYNAFGPSAPFAYLCVGAADGGYHTFTLRQDAGQWFGDAELLYDGTPLGVVGESFSNVLWSGGVRWGCDDIFGTGRARFHRVELRFESDLGTTHCTPAVANSTGSPGALSATGSPYVNQNRLDMIADDLPPNQFGYLLASLQAGFVQNPGGSQGNLCLTGNIARFVGQVQSSGAAGAFTIPVDLTAFPANPVTAVAPGETWNFQCWYRDQNPGSTSNFTNALRVEFR